jgi:hypothetical protein
MKTLTELEAALEKLTQINERYLHEQPDAPLVSDAGVKLDDSPCDDVRRSASWILGNHARRAGHEDVACWRAAELRVRGKHARVVIEELPGRHLVVVVRTDKGDEHPKDIVKPRQLDFVHVLNPGTYWDGSARSQVFCKVAFEGGNLAITGVIGPTKDGDAKHGCGQIVRELAKVDLGDGWTPAMLSTFAEAWRLWHLNDMRAGCVHQRVNGWDKMPIDPTKPLDAYGDHTGNGRATWNMLVWVTPQEHPKGLLGVACKACGYPYGSKWLREEIPADVVAFLRGLPESKRKPAWV